MMKSGFWRRASLAGLVYAFVFVGLVFLQYSSSAGVSWGSGILSLRASPPTSDSGSGSLELTIGGLRFAVDSARPAALMLADGSRQTLSLLSVEKTGTGVVLGFSKGVALRLDGVSGRVLISLSADNAQARSLELAAPGEPPASWSPGPAASSLSAGGGLWRVGLPGAALDGGHVDLPVGAPFAVEPMPKLPPGNFNLVAKSDVDYRQPILAWLDKVWNGLGVSRFDATTYKWRLADGSSTFSEQALSAWIAEALRRGQGEAVLGRARQSRELFGRYLTWFSVPYFGSTMDRMAELEASDARAARALAAQLAAKDPALLEVEGLVPRLVDRSPKGLASDVIAFLASLDPAGLSLSQRVGLLSAAASAGNLLRGSAEALPNHVAAEDLIVSSLVPGGGSWFLKSGQDGSVDVALSLKAGLACVSLGKAEGKDRLLAAGQALVDGVLSLSDDTGFLPATVLVSEGAVASRSGSLAPEAVYGALADNPWYPHEQSFAKDLEPGVWAWTCSPSLTVEASAAKRVFSASFPIGLSHYLALYGAGGFSNIKLYGIDYSPDAQFESYNVSGYYYRGSTGALYLKMRHKTEVEKIELDY